jgi:predicted solute-binding protein
MFHRIADDEFNHYGLLRIDLQSKCETQEVISDILDIANDNFYEAFEVEAIPTKAIPEAVQRIASLVDNGYKPLKKKMIKYDDYFIRRN